MQLLGHTFSFGVVCNTCWLKHSCLCTFWHSCVHQYAKYFACFSKYGYHATIPVCL